MISRLSSRRTVSPTPTKQSNCKKMFGEDSSLASDNSSLGAKFQIPQAFLQKPCPSRPKTFFPNHRGQTSSSSSCSTSSRVREEANVHRLLIQAKRIQAESAMRHTTYDARMAQSMSVKLPAYHQGLIKNNNTSSKQQQQQQQQGQNDASQERQRPRPVFRGGKSCISSAAAGSFSEAALQERHDHSSSGRHRLYLRHQNERSENIYGDPKETRRWRLRAWVPRYSTTNKSTLVHV
jgi:hypothetical protein